MNTSPVLRRNWPIIVVATIVIVSLASLGGFFYIRGQQLMGERIRETLRLTASLGAGQFDAREIDAIRGKASLTTPVLRDVVAKLKVIRDDVPSIRFAYIMRRTDTPTSLEFVADADSLASNAELDRDHDGTVDENEEGSYPGDPYDITDVPALQKDAFEGATVDKEFTTDKWGTVISGYAPIRDAKGKAIAVLGLDMNAADYIAIQNRFFSNYAYLLVIIAALALGGIAAYYVWRRQSAEWHLVDAERSGLLQIASHRLGGPLTVFQWSVEFLEDAIKGGDCADIEKTAREHVAHMREGMNQLSSVLSELKEASEVESGNLPYTRELTSLHAVIQGVAQEFKETIHRREQRLHLHLDHQLTLPMDSKLIGGVLHELLHNAISFSPDGGDITIIAKRMGRRAFIEIRDRGCGIASADTRRVFQKFVRGQNAHLHHPNGSGLGLYIAKGIVDRAGGEIRIRSVLGEGTSVMFTLPC
jgi:signal transduction histidine kinase